MSNIQLNLDAFMKGLQEASNRTLGWVRLQPPPPQDDEPSQPPEDHDPPQVMAEPLLIESDKYRFDYEVIRYARFNYLLERDGIYEAGELNVLHDLEIIRNSSFSVPNIYTSRLVRFCPAAPLSPITGNLGVELIFVHDVLTTGTQPKFGLAYRITDALPAVYPKLTVAYNTAFAPEDD